MSGLGDVYAVYLSSGQSFTLGNNAGGNLPLSWTAGAGGLTVILTAQQYYSQVPSAASAYATGTQGTNFVLGYTDVSQPGQEVMDIAIPTAAATFVAGYFRYLGFSASAGAAAAFTLTDAATGRTLDFFDVTAAGAEEQLQERGVLVSTAGLAVGNITGTYTGIVRVSGR